MNPPNEPNPSTVEGEGVDARAVNELQQTQPEALFGAEQEATPGDNPEPEKKSRKKLIALAIAAAVVAVSTSSVMAYAYVRETPGMIMRDAFYATSTKTEGLFDASLSVKNKGQEIDVSVKGAYAGDKIRSDISIETDILPSKKLTAHQFSSQGKVYVKVDEVRKQLESAVGMMGVSQQEAAEFLKSYEGLIAKVDTKWLVITEQDLEQYFGVKPENSRAMTCVESALEKYRTDKSQRDEVFNAFKKHRFLVLEKQANESVGGREAYRFKVTIDEQKTKTFIEALKKTKVYASIDKCVPNEAKNTDDSATDTDLKTEAYIWVDKKSRTLRKVQLDGENTAKDTEKGQFSVAVTLDYFSRVEMSEPKADVTLDQLMSDIDELRSSGLGL